VTDNKGKFASNIISGDPRASRILEAFKSPEDMRTIGGIARDTGLSPQAVQSFVAEHPGLFDISTISPSGETLYALHRGDEPSSWLEILKGRRVEKV